jgi:phosphocarrier protein FPr
VDYPNGLHARPATAWVETARQYAAQVQVRHGHHVADAKNMISLLQLGLQRGDRLVVSAEGSDAAALLQALQGVMTRLTAQEQTDAALAAQKPRPSVAKTTGSRRATRWKWPASAPAPAWPSVRCMC